MPIPKKKKSYWKKQNSFILELSSKFKYPSEEVESCFKSSAMMAIVQKHTHNNKNMPKPLISHIASNVLTP